MAEFDSFRRGPSAMLLVMAVGLAPATVLADPTGEPVVNFKVEHYWVTGRSVQEIQASISENAPTRNGDTFYAGATVWNLIRAMTTSRSPAVGARSPTPVSPSISRFPYPHYGTMFRVRRA